VTAQEISIRAGDDRTTVDREPCYGSAVQTLTPGQARTAKASKARSENARRRAEEARAAFLRERGWTCIPPEASTDRRETEA
jgi:hypothetical protein